MRTRAPAINCPSCTPRDPATRRLHTWHGTRFVRTTFCTLFILGIALVPRVVTAGTIYTLVDHPDLQNGYHLTGTIETNGSLGTQTTTDFIQSWSVLITKTDTPSISISFSSPTRAGSELFVANLPGQGLMVTPEEIVFPPFLPLPNVVGTLFRLHGPVPTTDGIIAWAQVLITRQLRGCRTRHTPLGHN